MKKGATTRVSAQAMGARGTTAQSRSRFGLPTRVMVTSLSLMMALSGVPTAALAESVTFDETPASQELVLEDPATSLEFEEPEVILDEETQSTTAEEDFGPAAELEPTSEQEEADATEQTDSVVSVDEFAAAVADRAGEEADAQELVKATYEMMYANVRLADEAHDVAPEQVLAGEPADAASIAEAMYQVLAALNIEGDVLVADGDAAVAWNVVKLEGAWQHVDVAKAACDRDFAQATETEEPDATAWLLLSENEIMERDATRSPWHSVYGAWQPEQETLPEQAEDTTEEPQQAEDTNEEPVVDEGANEDSTTEDTSVTLESKTSKGFKNDSGDGEDVGEVVPLSSQLNLVIYTNHEMRIGWDLPETYNGYEMYEGWYHEHAYDTGGLDATDSCLPWRDYGYYVTKITVVGDVRVENAQGLFEGMSSVTSANVSKLNMSDCRSAQNMFKGCSKLKTLDMSGWNVGYIYSDGMYDGCTSLASVKVGTGFYWSASLPTYSVSGHTDWYSAKAKKWMTASEIWATRDRIADTYTKTASATAKRDISTSACTASIGTMAWTGGQRKPNPTVKWKGTKLTKDKHYKIVAYGTNKNNGTKGNWVKIQGIGSYKGTRTVKFTIKKPNVCYRTKQRGYSTSAWSKNGKTSGKTGQSKRLEKLGVKLSNKPVKGGITYRVYQQKRGWSTWKSNGTMAGASDLRSEIVQIKLTGTMAEKYDVWYRVYAQKFGWLGWAKNGAKAGTYKYNYRLEAVQVKLVPKGKAAPGSTKNAFRQKSATPAKTKTYKWQRDSWNFQNYDTNIDLNAYIDVFGEVQGRALYYSESTYANGVCYGFSTSVGSIVKHKHPSASTFGANNIHGIAGYDRTSKYNMTAYDYIERCFLIQSQSDLSAERSAHRCTSSARYTNFVKAVKTHQYGGTAIEVCFINASGGGHSVFPLGIRSDTSAKTVIDIYDNNYPDELQTLTINKSGGKYVSWSCTNGYNSYNYDLSYDTPADNAAKTVDGKGSTMGTVFDNKTMTLVTTDTDLTIEAGGKTYELTPDNTSDLSMVIPVHMVGDTNTETTAYWVGFDTSDMTVQSLDEDANISVATDTGSVAVEAEEGSTLHMSVSDTAANSVSIEGEKGDAFQVSYLEDNGNKGVNESEVTGTATGTVVETSLDADGDVDVTGARVQ